MPDCLGFTLCEDKGTWRQEDTSEKQGLGLNNPHEFFPTQDVLWFSGPVLACKAKVLIPSSLPDCSSGKLFSSQLHPFRGHQNRLVPPVTSRSYFNGMKQMLKWIVATKPARRKHNRRNLDISWRVFLHKLNAATAVEWKVIRLINWKSLRSCHSLLCLCWSCTEPGSFCSANINKEYLMKKGDWRRVELFEEFRTMMWNICY